MRLRDLIQNGNIVDSLRGQTKEEAIAELVDVLVESEQIPFECREEALIALLKREAIAPTGLGMSVAIPHAQIRGINSIRVAMGLSQHGIDFDGVTAHVVFLFISPEDKTSDHLEFLALVSRLSSIPNYIRNIRAARTRTRIFRVIKEAEDRMFPGPSPLYD